MENEIMQDRQFELDNELTIRQQIEIEEILWEATRWGFRDEIKIHAQKKLLADPTMDVLDAYYHAFNELIEC